ncbi:TnsA endonuclease N-terminal domain-containing protein [Phenylobacterium sp.]|uniref:TnsA endonuclease N-terminal domain-containing protein n=1 Tax=Phenylobacterium sp. TaxID=1871053 RepID=UPI0025E03AFE|nr:TnsA endonuclease N-terminal domain-containing protein [Phenylobacterium sp.]
MLEIERREHRIAWLRTSATIYQRADRGPMRPVGRRRGVRPGGLYSSHKNGKMVGFESLAERDAIYCAEVLPQVVSYRSQPHTIEAIIDGVARRYTPDLEETLSNGQIRITEVKEDFEASRDPDYAAKLNLFATVYRGMGWDFRILQRREFGGTLEFAGICKVQSFRRVAFDAHDLALVREHLAGGTRPLGELADLFQTPVIGLATVAAMMVARLMLIDLSGGFTTDALVREFDDRGA